MNAPSIDPHAAGARSVTLHNIRAAAQQEKNHYELLISRAVGGKPATTTIYVSDEVFASPESLLTTPVVGEVSINAYRLAPPCSRARATSWARTSRATPQ